MAKNPSKKDPPHLPHSDFTWQQYEATSQLATVTIGLPAEKPVGTSKSFKGPVGLQLYSLRAQFTRNVPATVKTVQDFGIHEVELAGTYNMKNDAFNVEKKTSVLFVSVSFIVLMLISLAWLVFYYIQRFR